MQWEIKSVLFSEISPEDNSEIKNLLLSGWEPLSVATYSIVNNALVNIMLFRRKAKESTFGNVEL